MDTVIRAAAIYFFLLLMLRGGGKRTLSQITTFDFVLLLILGEATQQALIGNDFSVTTGLLLIGSLIGLDMTMGFVKRHFSALDRIVEGLPVVIVEDGQPLRDRMERASIDEADVMAAARERQGLERMEQIKFAVLERSGGISIIPRRET